MKMFIVSALH